MKKYGPGRRKLRTIEEEKEHAEKLRLQANAHAKKYQAKKAAERKAAKGSSGDHA